MPDHILLTPLKWFQEIGHYPEINVDGGNLKVSCALAAAPDLLLSNNAVKRARLRKIGGGETASS